WEASGYLRADVRSASVAAIREERCAGSRIRREQGHSRRHQLPIQLESGRARARRYSAEAPVSESFPHSHAKLRVEHQLPFSANAFRAPAVEAAQPDGRLHLFALDR